MYYLYYMDPLKILVAIYDSAANGCQDFLDNLIWTIRQWYHQQITVDLLRYTQFSEIPQNPKWIYFFLLVVPRHFLTSQYPHRYYLNTEQLGRKGNGVIALLQFYRKMGIVVTDYDRHQSTLFQLVYLPYPIISLEDQQLQQLIRETPKTCDVCLCCINRSLRREAIFEQLLEHNIKVMNIEGWKEKRDQQIAQSKILLNIHYADDYLTFEHFRCDRWVLNGLLVLTEPSQSDDLLDLKPLMIVTTYENVVSKIQQILSHYDQYYQEYLQKLSRLRQPILEQREKDIKNFLADVVCPSRSLNKS